MSLTTLLLTCHQSELIQMTSSTSKGSQGKLFQVSTCTAKVNVLLVGKMDRMDGYWEATNSFCHCGLKSKNSHEDFLMYSGILFLSNIYEIRQDMYINHNFKALYPKVFFNSCVLFK